MAKVKLDDNGIRQWILSDVGLYQEARDFGGGGDDEMYAKLPEFIKKNRKRLKQYINDRLNEKPAK
jgi:hypothetical protein